MMRNDKPNRDQPQFDFSSSMINIDTVMDSIVAAQKQAGKEPTLEIAVIDRYTGKKYRRFQKRSKEEEEAYQNSKAVFVDKRDSGPAISPEGDVKEEDDNDGLYICEYCSHLKCPLGSTVPKYDSSICDSCTECAECVEFAEYECSGCSYSRYREGVPYSELVSADKILSAHDMDVFEKIERSRLTGKQEETKYDDHYSILDF